MKKRYSNQRPTDHPPGMIIATFKGSGSGRGDQFACDPHKVLDDVPDEHVSIEQAEKR